MGRKSDKKTKKDKKNKKMTGRQREQQRKIMKLAKLFKSKQSSSSSSSSSSSDDDPRQNSQIQRNLRRQSLRLAAEALNEQLGLGLNSQSSNSSSTIPSESWSAKAGTLAQALGTVLAAQPPTRRAVPKQDQPQKAGMPPFPPFPPVAAPNTPPGAWPQIPPNQPGVPCFPPPFSWFPPPPPLPFARTVAPEPEGLITKQHPAGPKAAQEQAAPKAAQEPPSVQVANLSSTAMEIATMVDTWNLDTRKCNNCKQWTYYRNGICLNKQCPLNRPFTKQVYMFGKFYVYSM